MAKRIENITLTSGQQLTATQLWPWYCRWTNAEKTGDQVNREHNTNFPTQTLMCSSLATHDKLTATHPHTHTHRSGRNRVEGGWGGCCLPWWLNTTIQHNTKVRCGGAPVTPRSLCFFFVSLHNVLLAVFPSCVCCVCSVYQGFSALLSSSLLFLFLFLFAYCILSLCFLFDFDFLFSS